MVHDHDREQPVYFTWAILNWDLPDEVRDRIDLKYEGFGAPGRDFLERVQRPVGLVRVPGPTGTPSRQGVSTNSYTRRIVRDYAEQDARNRQLGFAGEKAVLESERSALIAGRRADLAELVLHVAKVEGDGAGYDIKGSGANGQAASVTLTFGELRTNGERTW